MPGFEYQRDTVAQGSTLRRVLLFGAVALVTGGGLWLLVPSGEKEKKAEPAATEKTEATNPDSKVETLIPDGESTSDAAAKKDGSAEAGETASNGDGAAKEGADASDPASEGTGEAADRSSDDAEKAGQEQPSDATAVPEKDKPWIGDPSAAEDAPVIPPDGKISQTGADTADGTLESAVPYSAAWRKLAQARTLENWSLVSGETENGEVVAHKVVSGDSLSRLAVKYHCAADAIRLRNKLKNDRIQVGMTLKLVPGPWRVEVSKSARVLCVYRKNGGKETLFLVFDVGIGRLGKTPTADFTICTRLRHPAWYAPDGGIYPYGDAGNPLGDYFLKLAAAGKSGRPLRGFGIHGTRDEADVTRSRSNGCIRMRNRDVERLYQLLPVGTPVRIAE